MNPKLLKKTCEQKVLRDPVHHYIHIGDQVIWDVLGSREFQRLRRIRQLGGDCMVYHTGDHSRFAHSLGVYEICRRILQEVPSLQDQLAPEEQIVCLLAALLHDVGHGPCSHMFESITRIPHEEMGIRLILDPASEVHQILAGYDPTLPQAVALVLLHPGQEQKVADLLEMQPDWKESGSSPAVCGGCGNPDQPFSASDACVFSFPFTTEKRALMTSIVSSQLDADRMDYLLRDAYFTGTQYGSFDLERILRTMRVVDGKLCIKYSGVRSVEDYIAARSQMYWQVYLHPDAFGYELLIDLFFQRYSMIRQNKELQMDLFEQLYQPLDAQRFFEMDDAWLQYGFSCATRHPDSVFANLAHRLLNRQLFDWIENPTQDQIDEIRYSLEEHGLDPDYYLFLKQPVFNQVRPYSESQESAIQVWSRQGDLVPLSKVSAIARALEQVDDEPVSVLYYACLKPEE